MEPGRIVDNRFEVVRLASVGGMGAVYQSRDQSTGKLVALKVVLSGKVRENYERFAREARLMSDLAHPAIVGYVAHGELEPGKHYLVMEWLEGEDLGQHLAHAGVSPLEAVGLAIRVAEALGAAHARGIVHRDIKPSNLFLEGGDIARVKVLDFGIATVAHRERDLTRTGTTIGTPGYIAPEQARGGGRVDGRVDLFSLGCVLFELLVGRAPFVGEHPIAVLAKVLVEDPPRVRDLVGALPIELDELVARLLEKDPEKRPRDAAEAARALASVTPLLAELSLGPTSTRHSVLTKSEHRLVSVVFARGAIGFANADIATAELDARLGISSDAPTLAATTLGARLEPIRNVIDVFGGHIETLADGSLVVAFVGKRGVTDQVARAARAALALLRLLPGVAIALATGKTLLTGGAASGDAIDRATLLAAPSDPPTDPARVRLDEVTARLIEGRFDLDERSGVFELVGEHTTDARPSLSPVGPCVGRDRELASLASLFEQCVAEPLARVVLLVAGPGIGKSRLRRELVGRLARVHPDLLVLTARGDPMSAGAPLGMVVQIVRDACGVAADASEAECQRRIVAHAREVCAPEDADRVATFLAEIAGGRFGEDRGLELAAARNDPMLMGQQTRRAFEDLLHGITATRPLFVALDDLHWGDQASVRYVDHVLRQLQDRPILVVCAARPEIEVGFPAIFAERDVELVRLGDLPKRAAESLVRGLLPAASDETVGRVVERGAGNAFYLEELARAVSEGRHDHLPETVVAMVQSRIEGLEGDARLVLRAASVFGRVFWTSGVEALLGGELAGAWLELLADREIVLRRRGSRFAGDIEFSFRHALFREAAYGMLTPNDVVAGHAAAGAWLHASGEREPIVLAEHFERGGQGEEASVWYERAAQQALEGGDMVSSLVLAKRALPLADPTAKARLLLTMAEVHNWQGDCEMGRNLSRSALEMTTPDTSLWFSALATLAFAVARSQHGHEALDICATLLSHQPQKGMLRSYAHAACETIIHLLRLGRNEKVVALFAVLDRMGPDIERDEPLAKTHVAQARSWKAMFEGDHYQCLTYDSELRRHFAAIGDARLVTREQLSVAYDLLQLGDYPRAKVEMTLAVEMAVRASMTTLVATAKHNLALIHYRLGELEEAERVEREACADEARFGDAAKLPSTMVYLGLILVAAKREAEAGALFEEAVAGIAPGLVLRAFPLSELARWHLRAGDVERGLELATEAHVMLERAIPEEGEANVRVAFLEALDAAGRGGEAMRVATTAAENLNTRAARITDDHLRATYLRIPEHARILERASA